MTTTPSSMKGKVGCFLLLLIPALVVVPIWFFFLGPKLRHDRLLEEGIHVPGRLLEVEETGTVVNDSPELELVVEFRREDGTADTASTDFVPSLRTIHLFQAGAAVTVAYDADDPDEITLVSFGGEPEGVRSPPDDGRSGMARTADSLRQVVDSLQRLADSLRRETGR